MKTYNRLDSIGFTHSIPTGERLMDVLVGLDMCRSGKEAKSLIRSGGVKVNGGVVTDPVFSFDRGDSIVSIGAGAGLVSSGSAAKKYRVVCE
jgi:ribosomal protein S4